MEIEVRIDARFKEPKVIVLTEAVSDEVNEIIDRISNAGPQLIVGYIGDTASILHKEKIVRIYSSSKKVFAVTKDHEYVLGLRLYELESRLCGNGFVRISNSEIVNLHEIIKFDLSLTGTICVFMSNGDCTYVSRRYVSKIKSLIGL